MEQISYGTGDNIGGNKIVTLLKDIAGDYINNINNFRIDSDKLQTEDEEEFLKDVHIDKVKEYKNLLNRAEIHIDLGEYKVAKNFVEEANRICHNHHKTLSYNALCVYATCDVNELTLTNHVTAKIIKLLDKAKDHTKNSEIREEIAQSIAKNFYSFVKQNLIKLHLNKPSNWLTATKERYKLYYEAIAKYLEQMETCFEIYPNTKYLKSCVQNLCGHDGYAWLNLNDNGDLIDLGFEFFGESTMSKLTKIETKIRKTEPNFVTPEILYGSYFEKPQRKQEIFSVGRRKKNFTFLIVSLAVFMFAIVIFIGNDLKEFVSFLLLFACIGGLFQPFGKYRLNVIQRFVRFAEKKFISK